MNAATDSDRVNRSLGIADSIALNMDSTSESDTTCDSTDGENSNNPLPARAGNRKRSTRTSKSQERSMRNAVTAERQQSSSQSTSQQPEVVPQPSPLIIPRTRALRSSHALRKGGPGKRDSQSALSLSANVSVSQQREGKEEDDKGRSGSGRKSNAPEGLDIRAASAFADRELRRVNDAFECGALSAFGDPEAESRILARFQLIRKEQAQLSMRQVQMLGESTPAFRQTAGGSAAAPGSVEELESLQAAAADISALISESDESLAQITERLKTICRHVDEIHVETEERDGTDEG